MMLHLCVNVAGMYGMLTKPCALRLRFGISLHRTVNKRESSINSSCGVNLDACCQCRTSQDVSIKGPYRVEPANVRIQHVKLSTKDPQESMYEAIDQTPSKHRAELLTLFNWLSVMYVYIWTCTRIPEMERGQHYDVAVATNLHCLPPLAPCGSLESAKKKQSGNF
jgi:hypothetical protein